MFVLKISLLNQYLFVGCRVGFILLFYLMFCTFNYRCQDTSPINYRNLISFFLYTKTNPGEPQQLFINEKHVLDKSNFAPNHSTKFLIHGWNADYKTISVRPIKQAYLATSDYNMILVDWQPLANRNYLSARSVVSHVGNYVALMVDFLISSGVANPKQVHILGHSLGAHIAGNAGRSSKHHIARITGLDPALPLFNKKMGDTLSKRDAQFVDVIHTDGGQLGILAPLGNVDFYPNGGVPFQPGCMITDLISTGACSHMRAPYYFSETIMNPNSMLGVRCDNMESFMNGKCMYNPTAVMGENCPPNTRGLYFFQTRNLAPFGLGNITRPFEKLD